MFIQVDTRQAQEDIKKYMFNEKQVKFIFSHALTKTSQAIKKDLQGVIKRNFDRPVAYTRNSIYTQWSTPEKQQITVGIKSTSEKGTAAGKYLMAEIFGGERRAKGSEVLLRAIGIMKPNETWVPGSGAKIDSYGNMSTGNIQQILSALSGQRDRYQNINRSSKRKTNTADIYFAQYGNTRGVFKAGPKGTQSMLMRFRPSAPTYKIRFPFNKIAQESANKHYYKSFKDALVYAAQTRK